MNFSTSVEFEKVEHFSEEARLEEKWHGKILIVITACLSPAHYKPPLRNPYEDTYCSQPL